jgi:hypothetical protein
MPKLAAIAGFALIITILWDSFETIVLPRRVTRRFRLVRAFYRATWIPWSALARHIRSGNRRELFLSVYGPLSMLMLFSFWAVGMIFGFALLQWGTGSSLAPRYGGGLFWIDLYMSGTNFFTLGLGDVVPITWKSRVLTVFEAGIGFAFLAMVITYLPVLFEAFSRREQSISILDARAGSPPSAGELIKRHLDSNNMTGLIEYLRSWEISAAELMESHLSYPVLCYYRSQHSNESWLAALATILDTCALLAAYAQPPIQWQARMTFAIARHAIVDLAQVFRIPPDTNKQDRLPQEQLGILQAMLCAAGIGAEDDNACDDNFTQLRSMYDPYMNAFSTRLLMPLPDWTMPSKQQDNWRTGAWETGRRIVSSKGRIEEH